MTDVRPGIRGTFIGFLLMLLLGGCGGGDDGGPAPDVTSPAPIADLRLELSPGGGGVLARWTATGDDGGTGMASEYDLRVSTSPLTEEGYAAATRIPVGHPPLAAEAADSCLITDLPAAPAYYAALKAADESHNWSAMSNVASVDLEGTGEVVGIVYDAEVEEAACLVGLTVAIPSLDRAVTTAADGSFAFVGLAEGEYEVRVGRPDDSCYDSYTEIVDVIADETTTMTIALDLNVREDEEPNDDYDASSWLEIGDTMTGYIRFVSSLPDQIFDRDAYSFWVDDSGRYTVYVSSLPVTCSIQLFAVDDEGTARLRSWIGGTWNGRDGQRSYSMSGSDLDHDWMILITPLEGVGVWDTQPYTIRISS